jgi:hypothetical protein
MLTSSVKTYKRVHASEMKRRGAADLPTLLAAIARNGFSLAGVREAQGTYWLCLETQTLSGRRVPVAAVPVTAAEALQFRN